MKFLVRSLALAITLSFAGPCGAAEIPSSLHLFPLPLGTRLDGAAVDDRGDVAAGYGTSDVEHITVWNGVRFVPRPLVSLGMPFDNNVTDGIRRTIEMPILFGPDGTLYFTRADLPTSCAGPCAPEHILVAISGAKITFVRAKACGSKADGIRAVAVSADGRIAANGDFDIAAVFAGVDGDESVIPIGVVISGKACHDIGPGSIAALAGTFAAGSQKYIGAKKASPYLEDPKARSVAIRWNGAVTSELGSGFAEGVNANGASVGNDRNEPVAWLDGTATHLESAGKTGDALAITESGRTIVGNIGSDAVRWQDGRLQRLDALAPQRRGWHLAKVSGVTPNGTIFGMAERGSRVAVFALTAP